ncbi:MFS transporter [Mucilaginibacter myungsuensis]|uniref:MFS transporter n=2 Tax=Mucilaginibacter myungsuensis TaxID=649104 RepID=A0A929KX21_9SPHI|nr:MFS transporter [Mucilaginibacter myungsuensis]
MAAGAMFFIVGLCFASWASRIATIQQTLGLSEAALGGVLFALPVGLMLSLPFAGWAVSKIGSRRLLIIAAVTYGIALVGLGSVTSIFGLIVCLICFGFASNTANISVNTQAVAAEQLYERPILASFHGLWSLAGFVGAGIGTFMIDKQIAPQQHFIIILGLMILIVVICSRYLNNDRSISDEPIFVMPDSSLIKLGIIAFCSLMCEGAMFDWSVIYFKKVVSVDGAQMAAGYTGFMLTMASGRFVADKLVHKFGIKRILQISGLLSAIGLMIAVIFPTFYTAIIGFLLVGFGVSSVVPLVYSEAGKSKTMRPSVALAAVSTIGFIGFLIGPPVIGFIAGITGSLRYSFTLIAAMGMSVAILSTKAKLS